MGDFNARYYSRFVLAFHLYRTFHRRPAARHVAGHVEIKIRAQCI